MGDGMEAGKAVQLTTDVVRIIAPNPSPMTYWGTNTYLLGAERLTVIDPGPASPDHLTALVQAINGRPVDQIIVTHSHLDHSPLAPALSQAVDAPVMGFGDSRAGQSAAMVALAAGGQLAGGEGVDAGFAPDQTVADGAQIEWSGGVIDVLHTPGHMGNHICLRWNGTLFSGDHIMGWASSLVSPPDGDLTDFMASCQRLLQHPNGPYFPGHGDPVPDGHARVTALIKHRLDREAQIIQALDTPQTAAAITRAVYTDVNPALLPAAERNVLAHLIDLVGQNRVRPLGSLHTGTQFERQNPT